MPTTLKILGGSILKEGDTEPIFEAQLLDEDNEPFDLSTGSWTINFHLRQEGAPSAKIDATMTEENASKGRVSYSWANDGSDTDTPGTYDAEVEITDGTDTITFPGNGYVTVEITEQLA